MYRVYDLGFRGFPKIRDTILGVPVIRAMVFSDLMELMSQVGARCHGHVHMHFPKPYRSQLEASWTLI